MSDLYDKQHDAEIVRLNDRITELEASLADSNEALQVMGLKLSHAEGHSANTVGVPTPGAAPVHITAVVVPMQESCGKSWVVFLERSDLPEDAKPWDKRRQSMFQFRESPGMEPPAEVRARETADDLNEFLNGVTAQSKCVMDAAPACEQQA